MNLQNWSKKVKKCFTYKGKDENHNKDNDSGCSLKHESGDWPDEHYGSRDADSEKQLKGENSVNLTNKTPPEYRILRHVRVQYWSAIVAGLDISIFWSGFSRHSIFLISGWDWNYEKLDELVGVYIL